MSDEILKEMKKMNEQLSTIVKLLSSQQRVSVGIPLSAVFSDNMRELSAEEVMSNTSLFSEMATLYQNYPSLVSHENAKVAKDNEGNTFVNDAQGRIHQVNLNSIKPNSSYIDRISYLPVDNKVEIVFKSGDIGHYEPKSSCSNWNELVSELMRSDDVSRAFHPIFKNNSDVRHIKVA